MSTIIIIIVKIFKLNEIISKGLALVVRPCLTQSHSIIIKLTITPMLTSLSILNYANIDSEQEMLGYGISIILMNIGMYFIAPAMLIHRFRK